VIAEGGAGHLKVRLSGLIHSDPQQSIPAPYFYARAGERNTAAGLGLFMEEPILMQHYVFEITDLTSFEETAGELWLEDDAVAEEGRLLAAAMLREQPYLMNQGLCIVAFDANGCAAFLEPLDTVH